MNDYMLANAKIDTASCAPVERENLKMLMRQTNERITEAIVRAETILAELRGAFPRKDEDPLNASNAIDAERANRDYAEHLCICLREIARHMGVVE